MLAFRFRIPLLVLASVPAYGQLLGDSPEKGVTAHVDVDCSTFANFAKMFMARRGLQVSRPFKTVPESDWTCNQMRCIVFGNASPRNSDGKALSRNDVVKDYISQPNKVDFRWKYLTHGYWAAPNSNFSMGADLQLRDEEPGCSAKLRMSLGMGGLEFLGILPHDLYNWPIPRDNGRMEKEYMAAILKQLQQK
jgi:hypothetical protein